ncbi:MAG: endonuclease/exonuclease/phosphatase family protein [Candidatus Magasanikbacteria bacterium]|nr:endonuclease/exonuclease/phosphatase family protein [Candidatus Magasanikbacteria bacterium]
MKLITLNLWGGRIREPLFHFIKNNQDTDVFCFQEIYHNSPEKMSDNRRPPNLNLYTDLQKLLPDHQSFFRPVIKNIYGIGIFIKKEIPVIEEGALWICEVLNYSGSGGDHSRNLQWMRCELQGTTYTILNVHGLWTGIDKNDTPTRITQSEKIKSFMDTVPSPKILCGDFNLNPDTTSIAMLGGGMKNLIKTYNIKSTRSSFYTKEGKFADYIFVSPDVTVKKFEVLPEEVSDHMALLLEF